MQSKKIASVIVTYNPSFGTREVVKSIAAQSDVVYIVDNNSSDLKSIADLIDGKRIFLMKNQFNLGLAHALNQGIIRALNDEFPWVATFDQDSLICENYFVKLLGCMKNPSEPMLLSGNHVDTLTKINLNPDHHSDGPSSYISTAITSGNLIHSTVFKKTGFFDDSLFIDYIDHDFCFRLRRANIRILKCNEAIIEHRVGNSEWHSIGPVRFMSTHHSPYRRYFMTRNRVKIYGRYWRDDFAWVTSDVLLLFKEVAKIILVEDQKLKKLAYMAAGLFQIKIQFHNLT